MRVHQGQREDEFTGSIEAQTSKLPSTTYLGMALGSIAATQQSAPDAIPSSSLPQDWHVSIQTEITETNNIYSTYSWKLTIQNDSPESNGFQGEIQFLDAQGFLVDRSPAFDSSRPDTEYTKRDDFLQLNQARLLVPARSQALFIGIANVAAEHAARVATIEPNIHKEAENERPARE